MSNSREVTYEQMSTEELEQMLCDYQNEKRANEERNEWLTRECEEMQSIIDERQRNEE